MIVPWNDREAVERALGERECAAILCEPYPANMGLVPPEAGFLGFLREPADATGALLVFDEVISGFRVARGGAQEREGVTPDLTILGKVIGGGLPAAAYAGPRDLMERVAPAGDVYQAGTLSGNPLATAAGLATLRAARRAPPTSASTRSRARSPSGLRDGRRRRRACRCRWPRTTGLLTLFFRERPVRDYDGRRGVRRRALTPPSAARCSSAASTCRRRSSRPGSRRSPTPTSTWSARSRPRARRWRRWRR